MGNHQLSKLNLPYAIYECIDEEFILFETTQYLINLLGIKDSSELTKLNMGKILYKEDNEALQKTIKKIVNTKEQANLKVRFYNFIKKEYQPFIIEVTINQCNDKNNQLMLHFIALEKSVYLPATKFIDPVSKLNLLKTFQENVINESPILVKIIDIKSHKIRLLNKAALKYFNCENSDFQDKICHKFIFGYDTPCVNCSLNHIITNKYQQVYFPNKKSTLNIISYEIDWYGNPAIMQFAYDISELQEKNKHINDLHAIQKARNVFSAKMSHDLRTPLNAIINFAQFGCNETKDPLDKNYFDEIVTASNYMLDLLNSLLEFDKIELKELSINKKAVNALTTLKNIYSVLSPKAKEKNINFTTDLSSIKSDTFVMIDVLRKKQVISNLISNAIKYTPNNGSINWTVKIGTDSNAKRYEYHTISDNGIGMSEEFQQKMFFPFTRENNGSKLDEESSGLGLSIVKSIIAAIGGEISCESTLGKGTTFKLKLPIELASEKIIDEQKTTELEKSNFVIDKYENELNLLVCEDNKINQKIIKMILEKVGFKVTLANNGQEGLDLLKKNKYSLIIMDIKMPILNGLEASKTIRTFDKQTPIIALSANAFQSDIEKSKEAGMNVHLSKPIDRRDLLLTIAELTKQNCN